MTASAKEVSGSDFSQGRRETRPRSRRAEALAARILEGAATLAAFADSISDAEWAAPMPGNATDRRPVGVIVHHVASVYPVEIDIARAVASGNPVTEVTWEAVAAMNAKHAEEAARASKAETLALLRKNSATAADAVREFSDDELDTTAPFSLSFGAPVTAQFVIEDHALRHSWHHLARIRKGLATSGADAATRFAKGFGGFGCGG